MTFKPFLLKRVGRERFPRETETVPFAQNLERKIKTTNYFGKGFFVRQHEIFITISLKVDLANKLDFPP